MKKILLMGLEKNTNLGDGVIAQCTRYLLQKIISELGIECTIDSLDIIEDNYNHIFNYDLLIFAGGGIIKYQYQKFYDYISKIIAIAEKHQIPVLFNAVGVEGYDDNDIRCIQLKNAINCSCVKSITVRDDIDTLLNNYITNQKIYIKKVSDPAVWTNIVYNKEKKESKLIGIGVIREGIFESNGIEIARQNIFEFWKNIIEELDKRKQKWKIFTNGWSSDMKFAINLMKYMDRKDEINQLVIPSPKTTMDLIDTISEFQGVIAARLHANIISYSLDIPSVGIVWNEKCKFWSKSIGYPERFFYINKFDARQIVNQCFKAIDEGYQKINKQNFADTSYIELKKMLKKFLY